MRTYELALVFTDQLIEAKRKKLLETITGWLKGAKVTKEDSWGVKALAYPIKEQSMGFYHIMQLETENVPADFEKKLLLEADILRHLFIRTK